MKRIGLVIARAVAIWPTPSTIIFYIFLRFITYYLPNLFPHSEVWFSNEWWLSLAFGMILITMLLNIAAAWSKFWLDKEAQWMKDELPNGSEDKE